VCEPRLQVIIYDSDWNPQNDSQAMARCHRIGQTQHVKVYRLITRNSYEATMFERATRKLSLEQAVLGGEAVAMASSGRQRDANELERMIRLGAAAVLSHDSETLTCGNDADADANAFMQSSIEELLHSHTRTVEVSDVGFGFGAPTAAVGPGGYELDVNAEDFWEHVLPGFRSPDKLLATLHDPDGPIQRLKQINSTKVRRRDADRVDHERVQLSQRRDEFMEDVACLVEFLTGSKGSDSAVDDNVLVLARSDLEKTSKLLTLISSLVSAFTEAQIGLAESWLTKLEGRRVRSCRVERTVGYASADAESSDTGSDDASVSDADIFGDGGGTGSRSVMLRKAADEEFSEEHEDDYFHENEDDLDSEGSKVGKKRRKAGNVSSSRRFAANSTTTSLTDICALCEDGGLLIVCDGPCNRAFHLECVHLTETPDASEWHCPDCRMKSHLCLICGEVGADANAKYEIEMWMNDAASGFVRKCSMNKCGRFYHKKSVGCCYRSFCRGIVLIFVLMHFRCLEDVDLVLWSSTLGSFRCPQHYCCGCSVSGDSAFMMQCTRCPVAYHVSCVPKEMHPFMHRLNRKAIVCPVHDNRSGKSVLDLLSGRGKAVPRKRAPDARVNASGQEELFCVCRKAPRRDGKESWIACDSCEGWFHPKCVGLTQEDVEDIESYICDACRYWSRLCE
jgi:hypothetical protein